jgi:DNA topoisomerase VI subunit B
MNTKTNRAEVTVDDETDDFPPQRLRDGLPRRASSPRASSCRPADFATGTSVSIELEGKYQKGRGSVDEFLELTAIANPHAKITLVPPHAHDRRRRRRFPLIKGKSAEVPNGGECRLPRAPGLAPRRSARLTEDTGRSSSSRARCTNCRPRPRRSSRTPRGSSWASSSRCSRTTRPPTKGGTLYNFLQEKFCRVSASTASEFCEKISTKAR